MASLRMSEEKEKFRVITPRAIVIGAIYTILTVLLLIMTSFLSPFPYKTPWPNVLVWPDGNAFARVTRNYWYGSLVITIYPLLINKLLPKKLKLNSWELAFVCSMMMPIVGIVTAGHETGVGMSVIYLRAGLESAALKSFILQYASPLFGPKDYAIFAPTVTGGASVPWSTWTAPIAWYAAFYLSFFACLLFISALVRKLWVEIESLPFPMVSARATLIDQTASDKIGQGRGMLRSKYFALGFAIAFIMHTLTQLDSLTGMSPIKLLYDFTPLGLATGVYVMVVNPMAFGFGMFLPDAVLVTTFVSFILMYMILPQALWVPLRFLEPLPPGRDNYWTFNRFVGKFEFYPATPLRGGYMGFIWGIFLGLAIFSIFTHWRYFKKIFQGILWRKVEGEETEPLPYRQMWLGVFISAIAFIATSAAVGVPIQYGVVSLVLATVFYVALARWQAECGWGSSSSGGGLEWHTMESQMLMFPLGLTGNPSAAVPWMTTMVMLTDNENWSGAGAADSNIAGWSVDSYSLGSRTNALNKHLMAVQFLAITIAVVISLPLYLWLLYTFGTLPTRVGTVNDMVWRLSYRPVVEGVLQNPVWTPNASLIGNYIFGVLFVFIIYYLRTRIGGIFNYASAAALLITAQSGQAIWLSFILAWLIKFATRKIGGTPLLNKVAIPLGLGFLVAGAVFMPFVLGINWIRSAFRV